MALTKVSTGVVDMSTSTGGLVIAKGTTAQQLICNPPTTSNLGSIRENTDSGVNKVEVCTSTGWQFLEEVGPTKVPLTVDYLVVAGGGGGGTWKDPSNVGSGGGGGAGGLRTSFTGGSGGGCASESQMSAVVAGTPYAITVGKGGAGQPLNTSTQSNGGNSIFNGITSTGGGAGGAYNGLPATIGGSGGGGGYNANSAAGISCQGFTGAGGAIGVQPQYRSGGGGGSGGTGISPASGGNGGVGKSVSITATPVIYAAGGGGGVAFTYSVSPGGSGIGGNGGNSSTNASNPTANTGSGGGAGGVGGGSNTLASAGSSGVIILKYPSVYTIDTAQIGSDLSTTNDPSVSGYTITTIICANSATTGTGTIQFT